MIVITAQQLEHPVLVSLVVLVAVLLGQRLGGHGSAAASGRRQVLEHALAVRAQHPLQRTRHRVRPEEVVVQRTVRVDPLAGVEGEQLVDKITGVLILHVGLQSLLDPALDAAGDLHPVVEVQRLDAGPHLGRDGAAQLRDQGQLVLVRVALHDGGPAQENVIQSSELSR